MFAFEKTNLLQWFFLEHIVIVCGSLEINHDLFYPQKIKKNPNESWQKNGKKRVHIYKWASKMGLDVYFLNNVLY